jgi:hypothetical protein
VAQTEDEELQTKPLPVQMVEVELLLVAGVV